MSELTLILRAKLKPKGPSQEALAATVATKTDVPKSKFGVEVSYAYCAHCGSEYVDWKLDYVRAAASSEWLRCEDCGKELSNFVRLD